MLGNTRNRAFSLIELVIVVVIIGIIAAIAIPRMSRGAAGAADSSLTANLAVMRNAIDLYQTEHGGTYPAFATIVAQLTTYSNDAGATQATKDTSYIYGPYLRVVPALPVGANKGSNTITDTAGTAGFGWVYTQTTGSIAANCTAAEKDVRGVSYNTY